MGDATHGTWSWQKAWRDVAFLNYFVVLDTLQELQCNKPYQERSHIYKGVISMKNRFLHNHWPNTRILVHSAPLQVCHKRQIKITSSFGSTFLNVFITMISLRFKSKRFQEQYCAKVPRRRFSFLAFHPFLGVLSPPSSCAWLMCYIKLISKEKSEHYAEPQWRPLSLLKCEKICLTVFCNLIRR